MSRGDLTRAIEQAIGVLQPVYRRHAEESDLYEASLLAVSLDAAKKAGGQVLLTEDGHSRARSLRFRRSPGNLWSGNFTYALVDFRGSPKRLEIHLGVYVVGRSKVAHECDIAIIDHQEAERSRLAALHPRNSKLIAAIEAKYYPASPGLGVGRGFLGLAQEMTERKCSLVFPSRSSDTLARLTASRLSETYGELLPGSPAADRLCSQLDTAIRNWKVRG
ncbi:hypothetical protein [Streptomyces radicis]|uniref:Uncharacterized protein n=1 Tax=Streptomyces radicis TaxID=1750517 RepID=A0A3A9WL62_9ACTN|nr:hypothetical protein [Streptomyces radicis]RKN10204.1 hypothetical protein D7319_10690 [Streptomyces radicis]RKN24546.1 hypothetical protein D7318_11870 [Streptomyces radicis]